MQGSSSPFTLKRFTYDLLTVMAGLLLALMLNNVQQNWRNQRFVNQSLEALKLEHAENVEDIRSALEFHQSFRDTVAVYLDDESSTVFQLIMKGGGFQAARVSKTSWDKLLANKLELVDYELISLLTKIDESTDMLEDILSRLLTFFQGDRFNSTDRTDKLFFMLTVEDLINWEEISLEQYAAFDAYMEQQEK